MGEIKSTLDLVMEKTKHLSMTDDEKLAIENEKVCAAVKGLVQKYQDQILSTEMFQKELDALHQQHAFEDKDILLNELFSRLDIESDNRMVLEVMKNVLHIDHKKLEDILNHYQNTMKDRIGSKIEQMKNELKETYSISGSAVNPNIEADLTWQTEVNDIKERFHAELEEVQSEMVNP